MTAPGRNGQDDLDEDNLTNYEESVIYGTLLEAIPSGRETPVQVPVHYTTATTSLALESHPVIPKYSQLTITFEAPLPEQFGGANARIICDGNLSGEVRLPGSGRTGSFDIQIEAPEGFSL